MMLKNSDFKYILKWTSMLKLMEVGPGFLARRMRSVTVRT